MTTTPFDRASAATELFIFARFHAQAGKEAEVDAAFLAHAELPHTVRFIERMERLVDQPVDVSRARGFA